MFQCIFFLCVCVCVLTVYLFSSQDTRVAWRTTFLEAGGFNHLYNILINRPLVGTDSSLHRLSMQLLLKMVSNFFTASLASSKQILELLSSVKAIVLEEPPVVVVAPADPPAVGEPGDTKDEKDEKTDDTMNFNPWQEDSYGGAAVDAALPEAAPTLARISSSNVRSLSGLLSEASSKLILDTVEVVPFLQRLFDLLAHISGPITDPAWPDDSFSAIADLACNLWVSLAVYRPEVTVPATYEFIGTHPDWFMRVLCAHHMYVRKDFSKAVYQLSAATLPAVAAATTPHQFFLDLLLRVTLADAVSAELGSTDEQFELQLKLIKDACGGRCGGKASDFTDVFTVLLKRLMDHRSTEVRLGETASKVDKDMIGMCKMLTVLLSQEPRFREIVGADTGVIAHLFHHFLFTPGVSDADVQANYPKCKTRASRQAAFALLAEIVKGNETNVQQLVGMLIPHMEPSFRDGGWEYSPDKNTRVACGYVGLRNQASTCYMNSLLQQFFMMPQFRQGVLSAPDAEVDKAESLLYQVQRLFAFLSLSEKQCYDTLPFCRAYKDENGQPINVRVQQDAQEFFNVVCDRLEHCLKKSPAHATIIKDLFVGKMANQSLCLGGCESIRENEEDFYTVSLNVKNRKNLEESLKEFVSGEVLNDVNCDKCKRKADINKRACLKELHNTVIFHLKRFELNFETFQPEKLNSRFEFPLSINLEAYTKEGLFRREREQKAKKLAEEGAAPAPAPVASSGGDEGAGAGAGAGAGVDFPTGMTPFPPPALTPSEVLVPALYSEHPKEYYEYDLVGVLIHTGNAGGGHYYSFAKERAYDPMSGGQGAWHEFNDHLVR
jgi:ubiquitin C-terminal hydrolase